MLTYIVMKLIQTNNSQSHVTRNAPSFSYLVSDHNLLYSQLQENKLLNL